MLIILHICSVDFSVNNGKFSHMPHLIKFLKIWHFPGALSIFQRVNDAGYVNTTNKFISTYRKVNRNCYQLREVLLRYQDDGQIFYSIIVLYSFSGFPAHAFSLKRRIHCEIFLSRHFMKY